MVNEERPDFRILGRRNPGQPNNPDAQADFQIRDRRAATPAQLVEQRRQLLEGIRYALISGTDVLPQGLTSSLDIQPVTQQADNTCMIAGAIAIAEAVDRLYGRQRQYSEANLAQQARTVGIIAQGGIHTFNPNTPRFLNEQLGLEMDVLTQDPINSAWLITQALLDQYVVMMNSRGHWVDIFGVNKTADQRSFIVMDPLRRSLQEISLDRMTENLAGNVAEPQNPILPATFFIVYPEKPTFKITATRTR